MLPLILSGNDLSAVSLDDEYLDTIRNTLLTRALMGESYLFKTEPSGLVKRLAQYRAECSSAPPLDATG